jgi:hypothetical protein
LGFTAGLRALGIAALVAVSTLAVEAPSVAAAGPHTAVTSAAARVVTIAEAQRGKRYAFGAEGPSAFDCSGLVHYAYRLAGLGSRLGGGHSGFAMLAWGRAHHLVGRSNPQLGDVVIYGNGAHAAIYIGSGRVISALNPRQGIRITALHALHLSVTGFIHTRAGRSTVPLTAVKTKHAATKGHAAGAKAPRPAATVRTSGYVNLRSGATTSAHLVAVVAPGTTLRLIGTAVASGARWDKVVYRGHDAWVRANLVSRR